jgi:hypothetical protein
MKGSVRRSVWVALLMAVCAADASAQGWRGIVPLRSTRADVERLLGRPDGDCKCSFETEGERIRVDYAKGPCRGDPSGWNVPADTVLRLTIYPKKELRFSELKLDEGRYTKAYDDAFFTYYASRGEGVEYIISQQRLVTSISYFPTVGDAGHRCRCFPADDGSIFRTPPYDAFSPRSFEVTEARLDNFAIEAQNDPSMKVYVIVYAGQRTRASEVAAYVRRIREWLVNKRGIEDKRVSIMDGGRRDELTVELFLFPPSLPPPAALPMVGPCAGQ